MHIYMYIYIYICRGCGQGFRLVTALHWPFFASIKAPTTLHSQLVGALADVETTRMLYKA